MSRLRLSLVAVGGVFAAVAALIAGFVLPSFAGDVTSPSFRVAADIPANAPTVYLRATSAKYLCNVIPGCLKGRNTASGYRFLVQFKFPGGPTVSRWVKGTIVSQTFSRQLVVRTTATFPTGSATSTVQLDIRGAGKRKSRATVSVETSGTGVVGRFLAPSVVKHQVKPRLAQVFANEQFNDVWLGAELRARITRSGSKLVVKPRLITRSPSNPKLNGVMDVYVNGQKACSAKVKSSVGKCRIARPATGNATITTAVRGKLTNGFYVLQAVTKGHAR